MQFRQPGQKRRDRRGVLLRAVRCEPLEARRLLSVTLPANIPTTVFNVQTFGAVADGMGSSGAANATAINNAITAAKNNNVGGFSGGIVEIPAAALAYESGPITLASNVDLQIDGGAELQAEPMANYPGQGGASVSNFVSGSNLSNFEITGNGVIDGNGQAWWTAFTANNAIGRPRLVNITGSNLLLVQNITLQNSAMFHLAISTTNNVTINAITISAPGTNAPNTDGMDLGGSHYLVENCNVSTGDDNVVMKPGSTFTSDVTVTGCTFGFGHGMSIGGQTNLGLNGLTITNDTFDGTTSGIRMKASRIAGGLVTNVTISNITMTNVQFPININSYYLDGTIPTTSPQDPPQAITSITPFWQNITITNLTSTWNSSLPSFSSSAQSNSYSAVIWGLPEAPVTNVTLTNVHISGARFGVDLDHVRNVYFDSTSVLTPTSGSTFISTKTVATPYDVTYWFDQNIGGPASAGGSSLNTTTNAYTVTGGGGDIGIVSGSTSADQFNFDSTPLTGDATFIAQVSSQTSTDPLAKAGIMIRGSTVSNSIFAAVVANPNGNVQFLWRSATAGILGSVTVAVASSSPWIKLIRSGNSFTAFAGASASSFTQIGTAQTVTMSSSVLSGLAVTSHNNTSSVVNTAVFNSVELFCAFSGILDTAAPVTTATTVLGILAADVLSEAGMIYTWSTTSSPAGVPPPTFSVNDSNTAIATTVAFSKAGSYGFALTVRTASGLVSTFTLPTLSVFQTFTSIAINPAIVSMHESSTHALAATALDQFGIAMAVQPTFTWSLVSGGVGSVNSSTGLYTSSTTAGSATVNATSGAIVGTCSINVSAVATNLAPTVATAAASPSPVIANTSNLSVLGADDNAESSLIYTWAATTVPSGATTPTFSVNGTNAAKNALVTVFLAGTYKFTATIKDASAATITSVVTVVVNQTLTSITLSPTSSALHETGTVSFGATGFDQFSKSMSPQPVLFWSLASGIGSIKAATGLYTAPVAAGSATVQATAYAITSAPATVTITNATPTVATPAAATPNPVTGTSTSLSVLGADDGGESNLIYTWAATTVPTGAANPTFSVNGTNAAKNSTANFTQAGVYTFTVTIQDSGSLMVTSPVTVTVNQTLTTINLSPNSASLNENDTQPFAATALDQFQIAMVSQPTFSWSLASGIGSINPASGLYTAPAAVGSASVQATAGSITSLPSTITITVPTIYSAAGTYYVELAADQSTEQIWVGSDGVGSPTYTSPIASLPSLTFSGGPDSLTVDFTNGDAVPGDGIAFSGAGSLKIIGSTGNDSVDVSATAVTFDTDQPITYPAGASITVNGGAGADNFTQSAQPGGSATLSFVPTGTDTLNINAGLFSIAAPAADSGFNVYPLSQLNIADGANMAVGTASASDDRTVLVLNNLSIGPTGQLDLGGNDMIDQGDSLSSVTSLIASGFNAAGPWWFGDGLTSTLAGSTGNALGVAVNVSGDSFDGVTVGPTDVLVKYTMFGDADLSGGIDATDYQLIDNGYNNSSIGWENGDFNYDGLVDGDDYTLIDNAFNTQPAGPAPVAVAAPEAQVAAAHVASAVFASSPQITVDQADWHIKRLADWMSDSSQTYVAG